MDFSQVHICIILGTRPEAIKLAPVIQTLRSVFRTTVILTGQHKEMVAQVMDLFDLKSDRNLEIMKPKQTLTQITCGTLEGLELVFQELQPDLVLVQGDTTTAFAAALAAFYHHIPIGHVEAGLRTDDLFNPYPEEANRRLVSQITQLHFAPTLAAVENLKRDGVRGGIYHTGNTVIDALLYVSKRSPVCDIPNLDWGSSRVILATVHRRENWGEPLVQIAKAWLEILEKFADVSLVLPLHLNPTVREPLKALLGNHPRIFLTEPLNYAELVGAMQRCYLIMSDSGGIQEEAPSLGKPVLVLRDNTERPEAIAAGTAKLVGVETAGIVKATTEILENQSLYNSMANIANPFGDGQASDRILANIQDFLATKIVN
jgi:UDP-N-acetylglucosamine 2-epimerase (non-hydrolysing)